MKTLLLIVGGFAILWLGFLKERAPGIDILAPFMSPSNQSILWLVVGVAFIVGGFVARDKK